MIKVLFVSIALFITACTNQAYITKQKKDNLQTKIDNIIKKANQTYKSENIIISVMNSTTGKIVYMSDEKLATQYKFEPGSLLKPISMAIVFDNNKLKEDDLILAYNNTTKNKKGLYKRGKIKINGWTIADDHQFDKHNITPKDIITYSSNIGTLQVANRLSAKEFLDGMQEFGFGKKSGIDIKNEKIGFLNSYAQYNSKRDKNNLNIFISTSSYGQGLKATPIQLLKAYSVFNNDGKISTPYVKNKVLKQNQIISKNTANIMKNYLINTVKEGTARNTDIKDIQIGGKTATANIAVNGKYKMQYNSSFFGFANINDEKYTIGITVIKPQSKGKHWYYYYSSNSAVLIFKDVVKVLK